jgi:hypothetical protein
MSLFGFGSCSESGGGSSWGQVQSLHSVEGFGREGGSRDSSRDRGRQETSTNTLSGSGARWDLGRAWRIAVGWSEPPSRRFLGRLQQWLPSIDRTQHQGLQAAPVASGSVVTGQGQREAGRCQRSPTRDVRLLVLLQWSWAPSLLSRLSWTPTRRQEWSQVQLLHGIGGRGVLRVGGFLSLPLPLRLCPRSTGRSERRELGRKLLLVVGAVQGGGEAGEVELVGIRVRGIQQRLLAAHRRERLGRPSGGQANWSLGRIGHWRSWDFLLKGRSGAVDEPHLAPLLSLPSRELTGGRSLDLSANRRSGEHWRGE